MNTRSTIRTVKTTYEGEVSDYRAWTPDEYPDTERLLARVVCDLDPASGLTRREQVAKVIIEEFFDDEVSESDILDKPLNGFAYSWKRGDQHLITLKALHAYTFQRSTNLLSAIFNLVKAI